MAIISFVNIIVVDNVMMCIS